MNPAIFALWVGCVALAASGCSSCQGYSTSKPPIHPNPNMDTQLKYKPYGTSQWFADKRTMRQPPAGTVARGQLYEDDHFYLGMVAGKPAHTFPQSLIVDEAFVRHGQQRYGIYCTPCHSATGEGDGMVGRRLPVRPPSLHTDYMRQHPVGHVYDVIARGVRTMPAYAHLIGPRDRWAISAYVRALQLSQKPQDTQHVPKRLSPQQEQRRGGD